MSPADKPKSGGLSGVRHLTDVGNESVPMILLAIAGPTGVGKTGAAIELADLLRTRGEDPVAVNCDSMQVYAGLEILSGAPSQFEQLQLEHRLNGFVPIDQEFSAGRYAARAHVEIDTLIGEGRRPLLVGGTGLYQRAALSTMELRPPVPAEVRAEVDAEIDRYGLELMHSRLPESVRATVHVNDRLRVARATELIRTGEDPAPDHAGGGELWTAQLRHPTLLVGITESDEILKERIAARVEAMAAHGADAEARRAIDAGASRTARAAIGFDEFQRGDCEDVVRQHLRYGKRQMTWLRRTEGVTVVERSGRTDRQVALELLELLDDAGNRNA